MPKSPARPDRPRAAGVRAAMPLRVTRRGRLVLVLLFSALLLAAFSAGRVSSRAAGPHRAQPVQAVVVHRGDTLWSIARRVAPTADPRVVVDRLVRANHLSGSSVRIGQRIVVPGP
jgi:nucleoid-associated protein YgaU